MAFSSRLLSRSKQNLLVGGERISGGARNSLSRALGALKDTACVSLAKEFDSNIVKAKNHAEQSAKNKPIETARSWADVAHCHVHVRQLSKRHNWMVAPLGQGVQLAVIHQRCLHSSTSAEGNKSGDYVKGDKPVGSTEGDKSGGSNESSDAGIHSSTSAEGNKSGDSVKGDKPVGSTEGDKSGGSNESSDAGKPVRGGPVSWLSFLLLVLTGAGVLFYYDKQKKKRIADITTASKAVKQGPSVGIAAIGGPFNLFDQDGKNVTDKDFLGKWTLIYFGFTHCPDICPDELIKLAAAIDKIKEKDGYEVIPIFISVDPERDTVEQVREYVKEFHPKLIGLTGDPDEIKNVARAFRVYYMKTVEEDSDYLVDHSIVMYLFGPDMKFVKFFGKNNDVDTLTDGVIQEIKVHPSSLKPQ